MERSRARTTRPQNSFSLFLLGGLALTLMVGMTSLTGCDSGTQEPDAPEAAGVEPAEYGSAPVEDAAPPISQEIPSDGSIASDRFPTDLTEGITAEIPANMPVTLPIYPGAQPAAGRGVDIEGVGSRAGVQLLTNDSGDRVFDYYDTELKANGWTIDEATNDGPISTINASNGDGTVGIFITPSPRGGTDIFVISQGTTN